MGKKKPTEEQRKQKSTRKKQNLEVAKARTARNKERRHKKHERLMQKKKTRTEKRILEAKSLDIYRKLQNVCPKLAKDAHQEARKRFNIGLTNLRG